MADYTPTAYKGDSEIPHADENSFKVNTLLASALVFRRRPTWRRDRAFHAGWMSVYVADRCHGCCMCLHVRSTTLSLEKDGLDCTVPVASMIDCWRVANTRRTWCLAFLRQHAFYGLCLTHTPTHTAPNWHPIYGSSCRRVATPRFQVAMSHKHRQVCGIAAPVFEHRVFQLSAADRWMFSGAECQ
jgi:hypothetical protein